MKNHEYFDMEIAEVEAMLCACIALAEALEDGEYLRLRASFITLFYIMCQKLQAAEGAWFDEIRRTNKSH